jgi:regulator of sigma E protease
MITILSTVFVLGAIIFIHEFGHFITAKKSGVLVERFSMGFPPTILKKKIGETEYAIGAIPFGGYVKLKGENPEERNSEPSPRDLNGKPIWVRAIIMAAGSVMNLLLAIFLFWVVLAFHGAGEMSEAPVIGLVVQNSPADSAGLKVNDTILSISSTPVANWEDMATLVHSRGGKKLDFRIKRDSAFTVSIIPQIHEVQGDSSKIKIGLIGVQPLVTFVPQGPFKAVGGAFGLFGEMIKAMGLFFKKAFGPGLEKGDVGGPILIAKMAGTTAQAGWAAFLFFIAALSINLGVINLFPIPVLDGGHLLFLAIEAVRKKPVSVKVRLAFQQAGMLVILLLMIYVTVNDVFFVFVK